MKEIASRYFATRSSLAYFSTAFKRLESEAGAPPKDTAITIPDAIDQPLITPTPSTFDVSGMEVSTAMDDFPSPSKWLYDMSCAFTGDGGLPVDMELL